MARERPLSLCCIIQKEVKRFVSKGRVNFNQPTSQINTIPISKIKTEKAKHNGNRSRQFIPWRWGEFPKIHKNEELFETGKKKTKMATEKLAKFTERETRMTLKYRK